MEEEPNALDLNPEGVPPEQRKTKRRKITFSLTRKKPPKRPKTRKAKTKPPKRPSTSEQTELVVDPVTPTTPPKKRGRPRKYPLPQETDTKTGSNNTVPPLSSASISGVDPSTLDVIENLKLSPKEIAFVSGYVSHFSASKAAKEIGLVSANAPYRYLKRPKVAKALEILGKQDLKAMVSKNLARMALDVVKETAIDKSVSPGVRLHAAKDILDRAGVTAPKEISINSPGAVRDKDSLTKELFEYLQEALGSSGGTDQTPTLKLVSGEKP